VRGSERDQTRVAEITSEQKAALRAMSDEIREKAIRVIDRLNDIGQLVEDGFVDRRVVLGKYHVMIIQSCCMVEAVRRQEERQRGGNYGQRILRMRKWATMYNDVWPKHRAMGIKIAQHQAARVLLETGVEAPVDLSSVQRTIYLSPKPTILRRIAWVIRRWLSWYG
jgi:hypothetical protein